MPELRQSLPRGDAPGAAPRPEHDGEELPPPGQRSGEGVHTVLPYLTRSLQSRPAGHADERQVPAADGALSALLPGNGRP